METVHIEIISDRNDLSIIARNVEMRAAFKHEPKSILSSFNVQIYKITRKLSYREDDRAMRIMYGRPENFQESLTTPTATSPEFFYGLLLRLSL